SLAREAGLGDMIEAVDAWLRDQSAADTFEWWERRFLPDWSGDGRPDDLSMHYTFAVDGLDVRTRVTLRAAEGDTGELLWARRWTRDDDTYLWPIEADVGRRGKPGLVLVEVRGVEFETTGIDYTLRALTSHGKRLWVRSFTSTITGQWPITFTATDYVVGLGTFDALPRRAADVLVASGTVVVPPVWSLSSGVIDAEVIDGRDGRIVAHPVPEVGVGIVPLASPMGDLDGDGLDDYAFVNERPNVTPGEDGGTVPVGVGTGVVAARRGSDGAPLWTGGGLDYRERNVSLMDLGDIVGTDEGDVFVETMAQLLDPDDPDQYLTYLLDGATGNVVWKRRGQWPYSPGDIDGDGSPDILTQHYYSDDGFVATHVRAFTDTGRRLWHRQYRTEHPLQRCCSWLIHWGGGWGVGDYDGDELSDGYITHRAAAWVARDEVANVDHFVIDAATGERLARGGEEFQPLGRPAVDGGTADYANVRWAEGDALVEVHDGTTGALLTSSRVSFDVPVGPQNLYLYVESARLNRDGCAEVALSVDALSGMYEVMLDGADGSLLWSRSLGRRQGTATVAEATDANQAC
ncbi:MAG: hypothetical protein M3271_09985, partial [Actinomycetota bacterium]|nr:hypothetical protein [Actinomycetota bacterium]